MSGEYTETELATLRQALVDGHSAAQIAAMLPGRSRNAIIGKVNRMRKVWGLSLCGESARAQKAIRESASRSNLIAKNSRAWSERDLETAETMWVTGDPVERIAGVLQRTVSAVTKKMSENRGRFPLRVMHKPKPVRVIVEIRPDEAASYDAAARRVPLWELGSRDCRWPVNDAAVGETHLFCGHEAVDGSSYCAHHKARSVSDGTRSERTAIQKGDRKCYQ